MPQANCQKAKDGLNELNLLFNVFSNNLNSENTNINFDKNSLNILRNRIEKKFFDINSLILNKDYQLYLRKAIANEFKFDYVGLINNEGVAICKKNNLQYLFDINKNKIISGSFKRIFEFHEGIATVQIENYFNYVNMQGELICDVNFRRTDRFVNGFAKVKTKDNIFTYINKAGEIINHEGFLFGEDFDEFGMAKVKEGRHYYYIDKNGDEIRFSRCLVEHDPFINGFAIIREQIYSYMIDRHFNLISPKCTELDQYQEDFARYKSEGKVNYIDKQGENLSEYGFNNGEGFKNGFARVQFEQGGYWNYIDKSGNPISDLEFTELSDFNEQGIAKAIVSENKKFLFWGKRKNREVLINTKGEILNDFYLSNNLEPTEGIIPVKTHLADNNTELLKQRIKSENLLTKGLVKIFKFVSDIFYGYKEAWNFIDQNGKLLFNGMLQKLEPFENGLAPVIYKGQEYILNTKGEFVAGPYSYIERLKNGFYKCAIEKRIIGLQSGETQLRDKTGLLVSDTIFSDIEYFNDDLFQVSLWAGKEPNLEYKKNFIDKKGKIFSKQWYNSANPLKDNFVVVKNDNTGFVIIQNNNNAFVIDKNGSKITEKHFKEIKYYNGIFLVKTIDDEKYFMDKKGELFPDKPFNRLISFDEGIGAFKFSDKGKIMLINEFGYIFDKKGFDSYGNFEDGTIMAERDDIKYYYDKKGNLIFSSKQK